MENIISDLQNMSLFKKIGTAQLCYKMAVDEDKAIILTIWYQYNHNNEYFEELALKFDTIEPRILLPPKSSNRLENYDYILKGIKNTKGFNGIEDVFLNYINNTTEEFEIDRLLYIIFAISYDNLSEEILNMSYKNWSKSGQIPPHYKFLLQKTTIDLLIYKDQHKVLLGEIETFYKVLEKEKGLDWLKYQYTIALFNFYENGYFLKEYSDDELFEKKDYYRDRAETDDFFYNIDNSLST